MGRLPVVFSTSFKKNYLDVFIFCCDMSYFLSVSVLLSGVFYWLTPLTVNHKVITKVICGIPFIQYCIIFNIEGFLGRPEPEIHFKANVALERGGVADMQVCFWNIWHL